MKIHKFWPTIWIVLCTFCKLADRLRHLGPGESRYLRWREAADRKKGSSGQTS